MYTSSSCLPQVCTLVVVAAHKYVHVLVVYKWLQRSRTTYQEADNWYEQKHVLNNVVRVISYYSFSLIVKQARFACINHAPIRSWNQPVLRNEGNVSYSRKQLEHTTDRLRVRRATHCATPPLSRLAAPLVEIHLYVF